ncbi:MAG: hypothetical protein IIC67_08500 [Thaumarchaeota archaeon]|nr:hypothetical protein [Nitrososphaerota archaeon]
MKDIVLDEIKTLIHGGKIIIPLDEKLTQLVNSEKIIFQSMIKDNKFVLVGPTIETKTHKDTASDNEVFDLD